MDVLSDHQIQGIRYRRRETGKWSFTITILYMSILMFLYPFERFLPGIRLSNIVYFNPFRIVLLIGLFTTMLGFAIKRGHTMTSLGRLDRLLFFLFITIVCSLLWSVDQYETFRQLYTLFYMSLFYWTAIILLRRSDVLAGMNYYFLLSPFLYFALSFPIYLYLGTFRPAPYTLSEEIRMVINFPNYLAASVQTIWPFLLGIAIAGRSTKQRILSMVSLVFVVFTIILCESRGAFVVIFFMTILFFAMYLKMARISSPRHVMIVLTLGFLSLLYFFSPVLNSTKEHIGQRFSKLKDKETDIRYKLYSMDIEMISDKFLLGYGYGTHGIVADSKYYLFVPSTGIGSHNVIVDIWQGAGLFSISVFFYLIYYFFKKFRNAVYSPAFMTERRLFNLAVYVGLAGVLLQGLFRPILNNPNLYLMLAMGSVVLKDLEKRRVY